MGMGFAPTWLGQVSPPLPPLHKTTLTTASAFAIQLQDMEGIPAGVADVWEATGRRPEAAYTWDMQRNDNLKWSQRFRPRCRFDRLYYRPADMLKPVYFELIGLERLSRFDGCQRFPSDHWGILAHFDKKD